MKRNFQLANRGVVIDDKYNNAGSGNKFWGSLGGSQGCAGVSDRQMNVQNRFHVLDLGNEQESSKNE